jgi:hypothetical protein
MVPRYCVRMAPVRFRRDDALCAEVDTTGRGLGCAPCRRPKIGARKDCVGDLALDHG